MTVPDCLTAVDGGVQLAVQLQPRASRNQVMEVREGALRLRLTAPPVEGAANEACRVFLGKLLGVAKSRVVLVAGDRSRQKRWRIDGVTLEDAAALLTAALGGPQS